MSAQFPVMVSVGLCMLPTSDLRARVWSFLRFKDCWGKAVQGIVLRALWKAPTHLLGTVAGTQ